VRERTGNGNRSKEKQMTSSKVRQYLRAHVLGLVAIFVALSGTAVAGSEGPTASSSAVTTAKFKKLKRKVAGLQATLNNPVRGDLTGTFPNLQIAPNAVTEGKIADDAVATAKIKNDAVNAAKLAADSVGTSELKPVTERQGTATGVNTGNGSGPLSADCVAGEQPLAIGGIWSDFSAGTSSDGLALSDITSGFGGTHTTLVGVSNTSGTNLNFTPRVFCLAP
jgi:hypothetical protein